LRLGLAAVVDVGEVKVEVMVELAVEFVADLFDHFLLMSSTPNPSA
jgi:hypothetical protein